MPNKDYNDKSGLAYYWLEENIGRVLLVALFAGIGLYGLLLEGRTELNLIQKLARGMGPELAGIVIAAVTIDALTERRQQAERKRILISLLGSKYRDVTEMALIELRNRDWLYDSSLSRADLREADLSRANLWGAHLRQVTHWSVAQLEQVLAIGGASMPDAIRLERVETSQAEPIEGPTFDQWKEQYLLKHGGSATDLRDTDRAMIKP